jgi:hypothetical protein
MTNTTTATSKQINYALSLLDDAGYSTRYMDRTFAALGAAMRQRSGTVSDWLAGMTRSEISNLITELQKKG